MEEANINKLEWKTMEYDHKERTADWFWGIGLITLAAVGVAIWLHNYVFSIFLLISGGSLIMITLRHPQEITFSIDNSGIVMGRDSHAWNDIKSFHIKDGENFNKLFIETSKYFLPIYTINIPKELTAEIKESFSKVSTDNTELKESNSMQFMEKLGF